MTQPCDRAVALSTLSALVLLACGNVPADDAHRSHAAHVHGAAELNLVRSSHDLLLELHSPAVNLVGFEHRPVTAEDRARVAQARVSLSDPAKLFLLPEAAGCRVTGSDLALPWGEDVGPAAANRMGGDGAVRDPEPEHDANDAHDGHPDVRAEYRLHCDRPAALTLLRTTLFERFPMIAHLQVQYVTDDVQGAVGLTADRPELAF